MTWTPWKTHLVAIQRASTIIASIRPDRKWGLYVTDDDRGDSFPSLNIYLEMGDKIRDFAQELGLNTKVDDGVDYVTYQEGCLMVSLIESEEKNVC